MKRHGGLWAEIVSWENLLRASQAARRNKRYRPDVLSFNYDLERNLKRLQWELDSDAYTPGAYKTFVIVEPKRRLISAAPYRDRVVHHALCQVVEPIFTASFVEGCCANRKGYGTHRALDRFVGLSRKMPYCLRADIRQYFASMDHELLKGIIRRKIKCARTFSLICGIIDNSNEQEPAYAHFEGDDLFTPLERRIGLPIGNLTSQLWANVYLSPVDELLCQQYGGHNYVRYVDDFALFGNHWTDLENARRMLGGALARLRLKLHPAKTGVLRTASGINFLGFRVFADRVRLRQENMRRARRRMKALVNDYGRGAVSWPEVRNSLQSWNAHAAYGDTFRMRTKLFDGLGFCRP